MDQRKNLIQNYYALGYNYNEILGLLSNDGIELSLRQLKRILKSLNLGRRKYKSNNDDVESAIKVEINSSGCNLGYRSMHQRLSTIYSLNTSFEDVRQHLKNLDPIGVESRSRHKLVRRKYVNKGPNFLWHIDGYDKLKPYGFCLHGCIDGFSRKLLWLHVSSTNNDPKLIAHYYLKCVEKLNGTAMRVRADCGTENVDIAGLQRFFRDENHDEFAQQRSFLFGPSTSNQRIEAWWSKLRNSCSQFWMDFFKDMRDSGELNDGDELSRNCLRFCFMRVIQNHLDEVRLLHNTHRIRPYHFQENPSGKPNLLYSLPEAYNTKDYKVPVKYEDLKTAGDMINKIKNEYGCSEEYAKLFLTVMEQEQLKKPATPKEAKELFSRILSVLGQI